MVEELSSVAGPSFPREAHRVRDVLLCVGTRILRELRDLYDPGDPGGIRGGHGSAQRVRHLALCLRHLFASLRYLRTASTEFRPAAIQRAISAIAQRHPGRNGGVSCLVRRKWNYNFSHCPLQDEIDRMVDTVVFDPQGELPGSSTAARFQRVWEQWRADLPPEDRAQVDEVPLANIAVIAFAGLDTQDVLLWPLLVHELAHAISQGSYPEHLGAILRDLPTYKSLTAEEQEVIRALQTTLIRELLADAIAVRIMGFSYFCAQAECLKTVHEWPGEPMEDSGHPGFRVRLAKTFSYLQGNVGQPTLPQFLAAHDQHDSQELRRYVQRWEQRIDPDHVPTVDSNGVIAAVAEAIVPQKESATLSDGFFDRIALLRQGQAPLLPGDTQHAFAEIMSASWTYELLTGKQREIEAGKRGGRSQRAEYRKTCDLVLEACNDLL